MNSDFELAANAMPAAPGRVTGIRVVPGSGQKNIWTVEHIRIGRLLVAQTPAEKWDAIFEIVKSSMATAAGHVIPMLPT